jgi:hypothetical protein
METASTPGDRREPSQQDQRTPGTDRQAESAGTEEIGQPTEGAGRGTAAEAAMKQTSKTEHESGSGR